MLFGIDFDRLLNARLFYIQQTPVTLYSLVEFILFVLVAYLLSRTLQRILKRRLFPHFRIEEGLQFTLSRLLHYAILFIGVMLGLQTIGLNLTSLAFVAGLLSVGIGFGLQNIAANFVSGIILLFERPIKIGDRITVGDVNGDVREINMRSTTIVTPDNIVMIVPNSEFISGRVTNWSYGDPKVRLHIPVGVSYQADVGLVRSVLLGIAMRSPKVLKDPEPEVWFIKFGESSLDFELLVWAPIPIGRRRTISEINFEINRAFQENGIEIPYPQRDVHFRTAIPKE
ncbi:MAG TPA: mechanosensitive ion channel domain-containing protein [Nitrospiria bacterium]|nr:mechanosensitive ion channel domain-containing protein [Nitrospiria bacterium]